MMLATETARRRRGGVRMMKSRDLAVAFVSLGVLAFAVAPVAAQEFRGSIGGTVTDPSGGALALAKVKVINEGTGTVVEAQTNAEGRYVVPFLIPGTYTVDVASEGFKSASQKGVVLQV